MEARESGGQDGTGRPGRQEVECELGVIRMAEKEHTCAPALVAHCVYTSVPLCEHARVHEYVRGGKEGVSRKGVGEGPGITAGISLTSEEDTRRR